MGITLRGYKRKERNSFKRERRPIIFINAEGKNKTEKLYFQDFAKDKNHIVKFAAGNFTDPVNMVKELKKYLEKSDFNKDLGDKAFCLIDSDFAPNKNVDIDKAVKFACSCGVDVILSVPCFEIWFISHFAYSTRQYISNEEVIDELRKYIVKYEKNTKNMYEQTKCRIPIAIENSLRLEKYCYENGLKKNTTEFSPSTEVYKVAEILS